MYIKQILVKNCGPIDSFSVNPQFNAAGFPMPIVFVGSNGSGKTSILSYLTDSLIEIACLQYSNITVSDGSLRKYFRKIGPLSRRVGAKFELAMVALEHGTARYEYVSKSGTLESSDLETLSLPCAIPANCISDENIKHLSGPKDEVSRIFSRGAYASFPSNRHEVPHWMNESLLHSDGQARFFQKYSQNLDNSIIVESGLTELKPWLIDVLLDRSVDPVSLINTPSLDEFRNTVITSPHYHYPLVNINTVLRAIIGDQKARLVRTNRFSSNRRLQIQNDSNIIVPSLDNLSAGQSTLASIFLTLIKYGDSEANPKSTNSIDGIAIIDEIDSHLHGELQYEALPKLMKLFPRIQFIVSSHSPLFALGLEREYGEGGVSIIELPSGNNITAERYSEFLRSIDYYKSTKAFEDSIKERIKQTNTPIILCEGETDPVYISRAVELLEISGLKDAQIEWIGKTTGNSSSGGGHTHLTDACKFLRNNPRFVSNHVVLLYDCDVGKPNFDDGLIHVRSWPLNTENTKVKRGIENLLPISAFKQKYFTTTVHEKPTGETVSITSLDKTRLCKDLCSKGTKHLFSAFEAPLMEIAAVLT